MANDTISRIQYGFGGAIVLLKPDGLRIFEVVCKTLNVLDLRTAPAVDRLIIIADGNHRYCFTGQYAKPSVLNRVRILKLVD